VPPGLPGGIFSYQQCHLIYFGRPWRGINP
jgi:hypothetical protein